VKDGVVIRLFGGLEVCADGRTLSFPSKKAAALFAYLLLHRGKLHSRARLADLLWEDADEGSARRNLSTTLWRVRTTLKTLPGIEICVQGDTVALSLHDDEVEVDVDSVAKLSRGSGEAAEERLLALMKAEALYRGELLEGFDGHWCDEARRHYAVLYRDILCAATDLQFEQGQYSACIVLLEKLQATDPLSDEVTSRLMLAYHLAGRRSAALALYDQFKLLLHTELGLRPSEATTELWNRLRKQGDWVPPEAGTANISHGHMPDAEIHMVGRERELGQLISFLTGEGREATVCVIRGGEGVGKSRLVGALTEESTLRGFEVLSGYCPDLPSPPPYQVFVQALWPRIERHLDARGPLSGIIEGLVAVVSPPANAGPEIHDIPQVANSAVVLEVLVRLLTEDPADRGTVLILEDVHRIDSASEALLVSLVDRVPKAHLVVVATMRDDVQSTLNLLSRLSRATTIELQPLGRDDTERLAATVLGTATVPPELSDILWSITAGVPLFSLELLKYLADTGYLSKDSEGVIAFQSRRLNLDRTKFPTRIVEVLTRRIDALEKPAREIISVAAVIGGEVSFEELEAMLGLPLDRLSEGIEQLLDRRLLAEDHSTLRFLHAAVRTAVLSTIDKRELMQLHRRAGELLERLGGSQTEVLAWHFGEAGDFAKASHYGELSGDNARALHANVDALRWYTVALARRVRFGDRNRQNERQRASLLLKRQGLFELLGDRSKQGQDIREVFRIAARTKDFSLLAQAELTHSRLLCRGNFNQGALRAAGRAARLCERVRDSHGEANAYESMGLAYINLRDQRGARSSFRHALTLFRTVGDAAGEARSLVNLATIMALDGRNNDALHHLDRAERVLQALNDKRSLAGAILQKGVLKRCFGQLRTSETLLMTGISIMREVGDRIGEARGLSQLANTHVAMGRLRDAIHEARRALKSAEAAGDTRALIVFLNNAAYGPFRSVGDFERAERFVKRALQLVAESGHDENLANYCDTMSAVLLSKGEPKSALDWAVRSHGSFRAWKGPFRFLRPHIDFRLGMCHFELGQYRAAFKFLTRAANSWQREQELELRILALSVIGRLCASESHFPEAITHAREVERLLRRVDGVDGLQNVYWNQYVTFRTVGSNAAARRSLRRAHLSLMRQVHNLKGVNRRRFLHGVKVNRGILDEFERINPAGSEATIAGSNAILIPPLSAVGMPGDIGERRRVVSEYMRGGRMTQREMAFRLGVSVRTIRNDVANLRKHELPAHFDVGGER
jgi:DNA-binding SARP family transcriptional activator